MAMLWSYLQSLSVSQGTQRAPKTALRSTSGYTRVSAPSTWLQVDMGRDRVIQANLTKRVEAREEPLGAMKTDSLVAFAQVLAIQPYHPQVLVHTQGWPRQGDTGRSPLTGNCGGTVKAERARHRSNEAGLSCAEE